MPDSSDPPTVIQRLGTLSDMARLRILSILEREELSVGEIARAIQLPQSTVSRHLKLLLAGDWVFKRALGTASLYLVDTDRLDPGARALWTLARQELGPVPVLEADRARLDAVLAERRTDSKAFFGRVAGEWDSLRGDLFGDGFMGNALLALLPPDMVVADLGCGTGNTAEHLAAHVRQLILVDREPTMIEAARRRLATHDNVTFHVGDLAGLPLDDDAVDAAMIALVLHHIPDPVGALREARRIIRPGGVLLVIDMVRHTREVYRHTMGHEHLGFPADEIESMGRAAGFSRSHYRRLRPDVNAQGPGLFVARLETDH